MGNKEQRREMPATKTFAVALCLAAASTGTGCTNGCTGQYGGNTPCTNANKKFRKWCNEGCSNSAALTSGNSHGATSMGDCAKACNDNANCVTAVWDTRANGGLTNSGAANGRRCFRLPAGGCTKGAAAGYRVLCKFTANGGDGC